MIDDRYTFFSTTFNYNLIFHVLFCCYVICCEARLLILLFIILPLIEWASRYINKFCGVKIWNWHTLIKTSPSIEEIKSFSHDLKCVAQWLEISNNNLIFNIFQFLILQHQLCQQMRKTDEQLKNREIYNEREVLEQFHKNQYSISQKLEKLWS